MLNIHITGFLELGRKGFLNHILGGIVHQKSQFVTQNLNPGSENIDTVVVPIPNLCAKSAEVEPKQSFINVRRNSSFCDSTCWGPNCLGVLLKFLPFFTDLLGPPQKFTFLTFLFTRQNNLSNAPLVGMPVSWRTVASL